MPEDRLRKLSPVSERAFSAQRRAAWDQLEGILQRADSAKGVRALASEDIRRLGPLYRRAASDLAYARAHRVSGGLVGQLNNLVARSYALLYQTDARTWRGLRSFLALEFPATFRRQWRFFLAAALFTSLGAAVSYRLVRGNPANVTLFVSEESGFKDSLEQWKSGNVTGKAADSHNAVYASSLMTNNIQVSFLAFALGVLGGILTVYVLFLNGCILGAFCAAVAQSGQLHNFWPGVLPHGVVEISAIFMAGGAGLSLGWAVLAPGAWTRRDAIALAARDSVKLVVGTVALLVFAGFVEGFLSHSQLPRGFKLGFAAVSGVALYGYLMLSGRTDERRTTDY